MKCRGVMREWIVVQVRWENDYRLAGWRKEHPTAKHYRGLLNKRPSVTWMEVLHAALADRRKGVRP